MQQQSSPEQEIWFQKDIKELLKQHRKSPPPEGAIVFAGSSILRFWTTIARDMSPLPVVNRAFGGARFRELLYCMDSIILPCKPAIIVCYCGSNDLEFGSRAKDIAVRFTGFCERVHDLLPATRVLFISINKAPQKLEKWTEIDKANSLVQAYCSINKKLGFIDINPVFFNALGQSRRELFISDGLHFMPDAYKEITQILKPVLERAWQETHSSGDNVPAA